jgi:hypothetical protein
MNTMTITCQHCQTPFTFNAPAKGRKRKYCSNKCGCAFHAKHVRNKKAHKQQILDYYLANPAKRIYASAKQSAKNKGVQFSLSLQLLEAKLAKGACEVTGLPIMSNLGTGAKRGFYSPSLDRIDNSIGYIDSNVRIVCWGLNLGKNRYTDRDVNNLSLAIIASHLSPWDRQAFSDLLPKNLKANLPAGFQL